MSLMIKGMELDGRPHKALLTKQDGKPVLVVETQYSYADNEVKVYPVEEIPPKEGAGMTNADRIRAMADEEMAGWLVDHDKKCFHSGHLSRHGYITWLKEEVQE